MFYSGIDLHKDNCFITTINDSGDIVGQERVPNVPEALLSYFARIGSEHQTVVESTMGWYWLNDLLEDHGIPMVLAHAKYLKAISYAKVKTDKVDSHTLATLLRMNLIPQAHKISRELRDIRDVMRGRLRFVQKRTRCIVAIHTIGRKFNCDDQIIIDRQTIPTQLPEAFRLQLEMLYRETSLLSQQILDLEKFLHPVLIPNDDIQRLLWVPGIGKTTAFTLYLEIDGIERFASDKHFVSYCRLVPGADNSNHRVHHRSSKDGNKYLKTAFTEAAVHAIQYYPEFKSFAARLARRSNPAIARTVVAKELARIVFYILKNNAPYRGFKGQPISRAKAVAWPRLPSPDA
jgi:transposase